MPATYIIYSSLFGEFTESRVLAVLTMHEHMQHERDAFSNDATALGCIGPCGPARAKSTKQEHQDSRITLAVESLFFTRL